MPSKRVALVTGGSQGIGEKLCKKLNSWYEVVSFSRSNSDVNGDVSLSVDRERCKAFIQEKYGRLDLLVNNAAINEMQKFESISEEVWDEVLATNTKAPVLMAQTFLSMLTDSKGTVLNVISNASYLPMTHSLMYSSSKAALSIITRQMARELTKQFGITVFGVCPNKVCGTNMSYHVEEQVRSLRGWTKDYAEWYQLNSMTTGKETDPEALAEVLAFICSEKRRHEFLSGCVMEFGA